MIGAVLGNRYELVDKIGEGGMAIVYKARCRLLNRYVAVKVLRGDLATDEKFVRRFQREALSASSLSNPNIVEVYWHLKARINPLIFQPFQSSYKPILLERLFHHF